MARRRRQADDSLPPPNTVRFSPELAPNVRGGILPRRAIPVNPGQPSEYRYRLTLCVIGPDGLASYRRVEYDSSVQIRPETLQRVIQVTLTDAGADTYRHGRRVPATATGDQPCGATVESITRRS